MNSLLQWLDKLQVQRHRYLGMPAYSKARKWAAIISWSVALSAARAIIIAGSAVRTRYTLHGWEDIKTQLTDIWQLHGPQDRITPEYYRREVLEQIGIWVAISEEKYQI